jgi:hypothetical protein
MIRSRKIDLFILETSTKMSVFRVSERNSRLPPVTKSVHPTRKDAVNRILSLISEDVRNDYIDGRDDVFDARLVKNNLATRQELKSLSGDAKMWKWRTYCLEQAKTKLVTSNQFECWHISETQRTD